MGANMLFFTRADHQYVAEACATLINALPPVQDSYSLVNLWIGLLGGAWTATVCADNPLKLE
ncbi:MAG: hypothetical protein AB7R55_06740 [Gemmatimonadales bacterium]